jgi:hypothetical protein
MFNLDLDMDLVTQDELDKAIPCDYANEVGCPDTPAKWIIWFVQCPTCHSEAGARFACDACKHARIDVHEGSAVHCGCGHIWAPARHAYTRCEAINKR